jgi:hypothetical protein
VLQTLDELAALDALESGRLTVQLDRHACVPPFEAFEALEATASDSDARRSSRTPSKYAPHAVQRNWLSSNCEPNSEINVAELAAQNGQVTEQSAISSQLSAAPTITVPIEINLTRPNQ